MTLTHFCLLLERPQMQFHLVTPVAFLKRASSAVLSSAQYLVEIVLKMPISIFRIATASLLEAESIIMESMDIGADIEAKHS